MTFVLLSTDVFAKQEMPSYVVASVQNQLFLARDLAVSHRDWERRQGVPTPSYVCRGMPGIIGQLGTSSRRCQVRG